jgi:hypothetical protein
VPCSSRSEARSSPTSLFRGRLVPAILAGFGALSSALLAIALPLQLAGFATGTLIGCLWLREFAFAFAIGVWLLLRGVAAPAPR